MAVSTTLIVGASRGLGLELVKQHSKTGKYHVFATVRRPTNTIPTADNIVQLTLDQANPDSVRAAASEIAELDTLIINAAIGADEHLLTTSESRLSEYMNTNIAGPIRVVKAFLPALLKRNTRKIVLISSEAGSLSLQVDNTFGFHGPYAVTNAAANMVAVQLHNELRSWGFTVVAVHPGWVATDMGRIAGDGGMTPAEAALRLLEVVEEVQVSDSASFFSIMMGLVYPDRLRLVYYPVSLRCNADGHSI
ncbi:hypothetical protein BJX64DRAFT_291876 [Aspergillus heterothallicus]